MRSIGLICLAALSFLACGGSDHSDLDASGSGSAKGTIEGKITNAATGLRIVGAAVYTEPSSASATTDSYGNYTLAEIPPGAYTVIAAKGEYEGSAAVTVRASGIATLDIALSSNAEDGAASEDYAETIEDAASENYADHEDVDDYRWDDSEVVRIVLRGDSIAVEGNGVSVDGSKATITSAGTYNVSGVLADGQIIVNTDDRETVKLILNQVDIGCSTSAPIYVVQAGKAVLFLGENTDNVITDAATYVLEDPETDEPNAAIFSKSDLTVAGTGALTVNANYNDGIAGKDGLIVQNGDITVNSVDDGIRGKDYLIVRGGRILIRCNGDGLKSDNDADVSKGYVTIENGVIDIVSGRDAIQAKTDALIADGDITITSGGGSNERLDVDVSAKGIKGTVNAIIQNGVIRIDSADDAIHSNGNIAIHGGEFFIATGDDGIHADAVVEINGGDFNIEESYEGIESAIVTINDGTIHIASSDDGVNAAGGNDGSGINGPPGMPGFGPGPDMFASYGNYYLYIHGGDIVIDADGDGLDINGSIVMTDGVVLINGPTANNNGAIDYDGSFNISGGFLLAAGSAGMAQAPGTASSQYSVLLNFSSTLAAGDLFHIQTADGEDIVTFAPSKRYQSVAFSSSDLTNGSTYEVYSGGGSSGSSNDGLYLGGTYAPGTKRGSFRISGVATRVNM